MNDPSLPFRDVDATPHSAATFDELPIGLMEFDETGSLGFLNPMVVETILPLIEAPGMENAFDILAPFHPDLPSIINDHPNNRYPLRYRRGFKKADGRTAELEAAVHRARGRYVAFITDVSSEEDAKKRAQTLFDLASDGIFVLDRGGYLLDCNQQFLAMLGYGDNEVDGLHLTDWVDFPVRNPIEMINELMDAQQTFESTYNRRDGSSFIAEVSAKQITLGSEAYLYASVRDISQRKAAEQRLTASEQAAAAARDRLSAIAESSNVGIIACNTVTGAIEYLNAGFTRLLGYTEAHLGEGENWASQAGADESSYRALRQIFEPDPALADGDKTLADNLEVHIRTLGRTLTVVLLTVKQLEDGTVATFSDISARKRHEEYVKYLAQHDVLTGLPNRALLSERLDWHMKQSMRSRWTMCVAFIDLDGFKAINDAHGHELGDKVLQVIASRLKSIVREVDTVARLGGDEFVLVFTQLHEKSECEPLIRRVLSSVRMPISQDELKLQLSCSVGLTFYSQDPNVDGDHLLRQADKAMYEAKVTGKNRFAVFDLDGDQSTRKYHRDVDDISRALLAKEFELFYQPKVNLRTGDPLGVEALLRWRQGPDTVLSPDKFLPLVEDHDLSLDLGDWVLEQAVSDLERLVSTDHAIEVSINVFPRQILSPNFVSDLRGLLSRHPRIYGGMIELEVVETSALYEVDLARTTLGACRELGVRSALDDFGTGYSSLSHLKHLPIDTIKIDRSFVIDMLSDDEDLAIVEGSLSLAKAFGLNVVAEGLETVEHGTRLLELGCEIAQGYAIARPMPFDDLLSWFADWRAPDEWLKPHA